MNINIPPEQLTELMSGAILNALNAETREALLKSALANLVAPQSSGYLSDKRSPLQVAFDLSCATLARQVVQQALATDENVRASIQQLVVSAMSRLVSKPEVADLIADHIVRAMTSDK